MSEEQYEKAAAIKSELDNLKRMICESYLAKYIRIHKITVKKEYTFNKEQDVINYANDFVDSLIDVRAYDMSFNDALENLKLIGYKIDKRLDVDDKVFYDVDIKEGYWIRFYNEFELIRFAVEKMLFEKRSNKNDY